ncbi:hypothetical protein ZOSMA_196G00320 [Zostera marina]|uniref:Uncharacterized protein n=1 Tax=Zostera marina TaxID=29655 RepID=A0A0K9PNQ2_ZOSMR|nr:hypothetical protein ZOSMA_196G00320 [Zostera marina]
MEKIMGYGRKALFLVRVLSGYEERRIRFLRLQIQNRVEQALERRSVFRIRYKNKPYHRNSVD